MTTKKTTSKTTPEKVNVVKVPKPTVKSLQADLFLANMNVSEFAILVDELRQDVKHLEVEVATLEFKNKELTERSILAQILFAITKNFK